MVFIGELNLVEILAVIHSLSPLGNINDMPQGHYNTIHKTRST